MKRLLAALSAVALLSGCSVEGIEKDIPDELQVPVGFSVYSDEASTRAFVATLDTLKNLGFLIYANVNDPLSNSVTPFMNAQKIVWNTTDWTYAPTKYWPTTDGVSIDFYPRYTDGSDNVRITYDWNYIPQVTFYVNSVVSKQTDMLWASPILKAKRESYLSTAVPVKFRHALTSFFFKIKLKESYPNTKVKVKSISLTGYFAPKATMDVKATDIEKVWNLQGDWEMRTYTISVEGDHEIFAKAAVGQIDNSEYTAITGQNGRIMVLPFNDTEYTITLKYDVIVNDGINPETTNTYSVSKTITNAELKPGYEIVNNLVLELNPISFSGSLAAFTKTDIN